MSATGAGGVALPTPNQVAAPAFSMAGAGGQVLLHDQLDIARRLRRLKRTAGTDAGIIDMVGAAGSTTFETARAGTATTTSSLNRSAAAPTPTTTPRTSRVAAPSPTAGAVGNGPAVGTVANKSATVGEAIAPFTVTATGGTAPYSWSATGLPAGLSISGTTGEVTGTPTTAGVSNVTVTAKDATDATATTTFKITVNPAGTIAIDEIQGTGATSPIVGTTVTTRGIVTAAYPTGGFIGFYIQTPGTGAANIDLATHTASDAHVRAARPPGPSPHRPAATSRSPAPSLSSPAPRRSRPCPPASRWSTRPSPRW